MLAFTGFAMHDWNQVPYDLAIIVIFAIMLAFGIWLPLSMKQRARERYNAALRTASEEQSAIWDTLSDDMRSVLAAHGGIRSDYASAQPQERKKDGSQEVWVYKSGGAVVTTYVFTDGKLTQTMKP